MVRTTNYKKHTSKNAVQKALINNFNRSLINLIKPLRPQKILDVGCGEGFVIVTLARNKIGKYYEGIDNSKSAINLGHKMYPDLNIKLGDIYNLPYEDNSFDLLICTEVLEHLKDPRKALLELKRVTKKYVILSVPNEPFFILANFLRGKYVKTFGNHPEHINHWTYPGFRNFIKKSGFRISSAKTPFPWTLVLVRK